MTIPYLDRETGPGNSQEPHTKQGVVYTFYSYKGGVGRSMALANVAALLTQWGNSVLVVDWDLEAPGIEKYFEQKPSVLVDSRKNTPGMVDLIVSHAKGTPLTWQDCLVKAFPFEGREISIITAGQETVHYAETVQTLDWNELFDEHDLGIYLNQLREEWVSEFDFVLIDSRTGINDIGGICTILLPDVVVLMLTTNQQGLDGVIDVMERARNARSKLPIDRSRLVAIPVLSRDESETEYERALEWRKIFADELVEFYKDWVPNDTTPLDILDYLRIPYIPYWSFGERLPVIERGTADPRDIGFAYETLAKLIHNRLEWREPSRDSVSTTMERTPFSSVKGSGKVYISSTYADLEECREAVYRTLRQLGHSAQGMEDYLATDNRPLDKTLKDVGECDIYVGIFAWRYGYIPERDNPEQQSVTELEYRQAVSMGIPCLIFVLNEDASWPRSSMDQGDGAERIEVLREELAGNHIVSFFSNCEELARLVAVAVTKELGDEPRGNDTTALSPLNQLPSPPRDFTGRQAELQELMEAITEGGVTISGLQGQGGIGKTALALVLADRLKEQYSDAQFYIDLRGVDPNPMSATDAMAHVVRGFLPTAQLPDDEASMRVLYTTVLEGKRALLLMDNSRDREQVEPLIPPSSCLLLVTSRQHFVLPGLRPIDLDTLPPQDAEELIVTIAPRAKERAGVIAELCGYLPHALRVAASLLAEQINVTVEEYVDRLRDSSTQLGLIDASLNLSYDLLSPGLQRMWRMLAVFPGGGDVEGVAAVWEVDEETAQDRLGELIRCSLVQWSESSGRYSLHDLARVYADSRLEDSERTSSEELHSAHYLEVLRQADALYRQGGDSIEEGLGLFDAEIDNIRAGQGWAADHVGEEERATDLCSRYGYAGANIFQVRLNPRELISWMEAGLDSARQLGVRDVEGATLGNLGVAYYSLGEYSRAIDYHEQRLTISRVVGDRLGEGSALGNLGMVYRNMGEYSKAIDYHEQHLTIVREIGYRLGEGRALGNLGNVYDDLGEYRKAIDYHEQSLVIERELGNRLGEGQSLSGLGNVYYSLGEYSKAIDYHEQNLAIAREIGGRLAEGNALFNMSLSLDKQGDRAAAIQRMESALAIYEEIDVPDADDVRSQLAQWREEG